MNRNILKLIRSTAIAMLAIGLILYPLRLSYTGAYFTDKATPGPNDYSSSVKLRFDVHRFEGLHVEMNMEGNTIVANMNIPSGYGFDRSDIRVESTEFTYNGISSQPMPTDVFHSGNQLTLLFDWDMAGDFDYNQANLYFKMVGKGSGSGTSGLGERFIFDGYGQLVPEPLPQPEEVVEPMPEPEPIPEAEIIDEIIDEIISTTDES